MAGRQGAWLGKPCQDCGGKKGRQYASSKFCGNCKPKAARASREAAWAARLLRTYGMTAEQYWQLYVFQGGKCYLCQRATGKTKRLAVDHDHACCPTTPTCGKCNRGLLCGTCNKIMGHARDDEQFFLRGALYLMNPPWKRMHDGTSVTFGGQVVSLYDLVVPSPYDGPYLTPFRNETKEAA